MPAVEKICALGLDTMTFRKNDERILIRIFCWGSQALEKGSGFICVAPECNLFKDKYLYWAQLNHRRYSEWEIIAKKVEEGLGVLGFASDIISTDMTKIIFLL